MDYQQWFSLAFYSSMCTAGAVYIYSIFTKPRRELKPIQTLLLLSFLFDFIPDVSGLWWDLYIPYAGASYRICEAIVLLAFYRRIFPSKPNYYFSWGACLVAFIIFFVKMPSLYSDSTILRIVNCTLFTIYPLCYYRQALHRLNIADPAKTPLFWVNSGILIYFLSTFMIVIFFKPLAKIDAISAVTIYIFHNLLLIVRNLLFARGFWT